MFVKLIGALNNVCYVNLDTAKVIDIHEDGSCVCIIDDVIYTTNKDYLTKIKMYLTQKVL